MSKKALLLLPLFLICIIETFAQNSMGKMINAKNGQKDPIYFLRSPNPIGNKTKYTILLNGVEIYEVEFTYYKEEDSIVIQFFDKQNTTSKHESIRLKPEDSHFLICNYMPNIENINDDKSNYQILFGIDNPNRQFITLYQFRAIGGVQTQFILQNVPQTVLAAHEAEVIDYKRVVAMRAQHDSSVLQLKNNMIIHKDSMVMIIRNSEISQQQGDATQLADTALKKEFTKQLDSIFINYFKHIYSFDNNDFDVEFAFNSDGYGKIKVDSIKSIFFKSGGAQKNWLKDSFMLFIKPLIEKNIFSTLTTVITNSNLTRDFLNWFGKTLRTSNLDADSTIFLETQKQVIDELGTYATRTIHIPTKYSYSFRYKSEVRNPIWKYNAKANDQTIKPENKNEIISENLKSLFREKCASCGSGKYYIKICTVSINGEYKGEDIQINKTK